MAEEIDELKKSRATLKSKLTRNQNLISSINTEKLELELAKEIEFRLENLQPLLDQFDEIQTKIEIIENINSDEEERKFFEDKYFTTIAKMKVLIESHQNEMSASVEGSEAASVHSTIHSAVANKSKVKLPDIKLPTFSGEYSHWSEFKELFLAVVDKDQDLSDIQKFYYLKGCLADPVKKIISRFEVSAKNYSAAWNILNERYENKPLLIHNHIQAIFDIPALNKTSHIELRSLYDNTVEHLSALKCLGENTDSWDRIIIFILCKKFDNSTLNAWESHKIKGSFQL